MRSIPVLFVQERSLALAYEKALVELYRNGCRVSTQYDKPGDPTSIDSTMNITVLEPWSDPMIHKAFPGGIDELREYVMELQGAKDHWVKNINDSNDTRWEYTYHGRFARYGTWKDKHDGKSCEAGGFIVDQIETVIGKLCAQPFTRQAQMITWMPNLDNSCFDPPCLQSLWYRILEEEGVYWLNCNIRIRSNDAWGANFMNMFGLTHFSRYLIADKVAERTGKRVELGRMNWHSDSWHIYGKNIEEVKRRFLDRLGMPFEDRTFNFHDEFIQTMYNDAKVIVENKIREYDQTH